MALERLPPGQRHYGKPYRRSFVGVERWRRHPDRLRRKFVLTRHYKRNRGLFDARKPRTSRAAPNFRLNRLGARSVAPEARDPAEAQIRRAAPKLFRQS